MKPVAKKDMPKLIALIGLTVCSLGFGVYQIVGGTSVAAPPPPIIAKKEEPARAVGGAPSAAVESDDRLVADLKRIESVSEPILMRDPFIVQGYVAPSTGTAPIPVLPKTTVVKESLQDRAIVRASERATRLRQLLGIEPRFNKPMGEAGTPNSGVAAPVVLPPPQPPTLLVTGILIPEKGDGESIAIVRIGDRAHWLSTGDSVGNGFVVGNIRQTDRGSELEIIDPNDKKRTFTYRVN